MENRIFRQESIDQVNSPDMIRDYLRVTGPRLWMVLLAVLALAAGFIAYSSVAEQEITVPVRVKVETFQAADPPVVQAIFEIAPSERDTYKTGMPVRFAGMTAKIAYFIETKDKILVVAEPDGKQKASVADGEYDAAVVIESSTPISELLQ